MDDKNKRLRWRDNKFMNEIKRKRLNLFSEKTSAKWIKQTKMKSGANQDIIIQNYIII